MEGKLKNRISTSCELEVLLSPTEQPNSIYMGPSPREVRREKYEQKNVYFVNNVAMFCLGQRPCERNSHFRLQFRSPEELLTFIFERIY